MTVLTPKERVKLLLYTSSLARDEVVSVPMKNGPSLPIASVVLAVWIENRMQWGLARGVDWERLIDDCTDA